MPGSDWFFLAVLSLMHGAFCEVPENDCTHGEIIQNSADISCRSFYLCAHGYQMLMTCAPGTMFDVSCLCCNHATMVSCTSDAASTMKGACKVNFGVVPNPVDPTCSTFIQCSWGEPYVRDCNPGMLFNPNNKMCDWPSNYACETPRVQFKESPPVQVLSHSPHAGNKNNPPGKGGGGAGGGHGIANADKSYQYKRVCFYPNWSFWRKDKGKFTPANIDSSLCTHFVYAYSVMDKETLTIKPGDEWLDAKKGNFRDFTALKKLNPKAKVMIAIGGWVDSQQNREAYNMVFNDDVSRNKFSDHVMAYMAEWGFDGLDISFEFPQINERQGFLTWVQALRKAFGTKYQLTISIPVHIKKIQEGYALSQLADFVDGINVMSYDLHGPWEPKADHHAPLFRRKWDANNNFVDATVQMLVDHGVPSRKIVLGIPTYGRSWSVKVTDQWMRMQPPVPAKGPAPAGPITNSGGTLSYMEICLVVKNDTWVEVDDPEGPYAYMKDKSAWVGYDTPGSVTDKASYIVARKLGGGMIWDLPQDDFLNLCGRGKFPLLKAMKKVFDETP